MYPESIKNLIDSFKSLPGIGEKTAERLAFSVLDLEEEQVSFFFFFLIAVKEKIHKCFNCNVITEDELCKYLAEFAKVGFATSGILVHRHTNEKLIIMKINSEFVNNDETATEFLKTFIGRDHGIR